MICTIFNRILFFKGKKDTSTPKRYRHYGEIVMGHSDDSGFPSMITTVFGVYIRFRWRVYFLVNAEDVRIKDDIQQLKEIFK